MEKEPAEVIKPEPVQEPKTANVESTTATAEPAASAGNGSDEGLFRLNTPKFESKIKVTGYGDRRRAPIIHTMTMRRSFTKADAVPLVH